MKELWPAVRAGCLQYQAVEGIEELKWEEQRYASPILILKYVKKTVVDKLNVLESYIVKIPSALATELARISTRKIGAIHLMITVNIFSDLNVTFPSCTSSTIDFGFMINPTKMQVKNATIGISTLLLMKSIISRTDIPIQLMKPNGPNPREEGIPMINARIKTKIQDFRRVQFNLSMIMETIVSINEIADVSAAKNTRIKNKVPITLPNLILLNTLGSVINIKPGPALRVSGSPPENANTAGMIIRPARKATPVSKISICLTELSRLFSFFI